MACVVVDTNVPLTADSRSSYSAQCASACIESLLEITKSGSVALDSSGLIVREYMENLANDGQPRVGDRFLKWVLLNQGNPDRCPMVDIKADGAGSFEGFPEDLLQGFDPSDRKFIAVAIAHTGSPPILQAADSKWWGYKAQFPKAGIQVEFLCPGEIEAKHLEKNS